MTISSSINRVDYTGNGAVDTYSYTFRIFSQEDLRVTVRDTNDSETTLTLTTDYTVTGVGDEGGGTIVLVNSSQAWLDADGDLLTDYILTIRRVRDILQETDIRNQGEFLPETHEDAFDHFIMVDQQQQEEIDRSIRLPESVSSADVSTELPIPVANRAIGWNNDGTALSNITSAGELSVSAYIENLLDDPDAATARATLGIVDYWSTPVADTTALKAVGTSDRLDNQVRLKDDTNTIWKFDSASSATENSTTVIQPTSGTGRWLLVGSLGDALPGTAKSTNYTVVAADYGRTILVDCSAGAITITLPTPTAGFKVTVKDYKGFAATNLITVARAGSELIDFGSGSDIINSNFQSVTYLSDGTDWYRVSRYDGESVAGRALFGGGFIAASSNIIDYVAIPTLGNATDFGDLTVARYQLAGCGSSTRGLFGGGNTGANSNVIDYVTTASAGNATDFGDTSVTRTSIAACNSSTRGLFGGGDTGAQSNVIDYVTIATVGNATDFGDLTVARASSAGCASSTRGLFGGGSTGASSNVIDYVTIASTGNATDFGDLTVARSSLGSCSSSTRGLFGGGSTGARSNVIDYVTIASAGNATDFGDLNVTRDNLGACSSLTRGLFGGGSTGSDSNVIDYVTIASTANATDFGDLTFARNATSALSNAHGGL